MPDQPRPPAHSPGFRNVVHCGVFFLVGMPLLALVRLNETYHWIPQIRLCIVGFMLLVTLLNIFVLAHVPILNRVKRGDEGWNSGLWIYPFSLAVCFAIFPFYVAFAAWAAMACGDAPASFVGRRVRHIKLFWNQKKTLAGLLAFVAAAFIGACISLYFMPCPLFLKSDGSPELPYVWTLAFLVAVSGALAESIDTTLDDNVRVPFGSAATLLVATWFLKFSTQNLPATTHVQPQNFIRALIANAILGAIVMLARFADFTATCFGMLLGTLIYFYAGWQGYLLFILFVLIGSGLSRMGIARKNENHTAEANQGKRGIANVAANLLVPAACCALYPICAGRASLLMAFAGSIAAALADTASSEIGVLSPNEPWLITSFKRVPHGTNGAVSLLGSMGAIAASIVIATAAYASGFFQLAFGTGTQHSRLLLRAATTAIFISGILGTLVDSFLGATIEGKFKFVGKGAVNFACTLTGAITAALLTEALQILAS